MRIVIIGFTCSGKSCVAKELGHLLDLPVFDLDQVALKKIQSQVSSGSISA